MTLVASATRRRWRSCPSHLTELAVSSVGYGIPDFASGVLNDPAQREHLRTEIEITLRRFEPRFVRLRVALLGILYPHDLAPVPSCMIANF